MAFHRIYTMAHLTDQKITDRYAIYCGDSCEVLADLPGESIGISIYSPPFEDLFRYSSHDRDLGNCRDSEEFLTHYRFIVEDLYRITQPGRMTCIHCSDLGANGKGTLRDFPGEIIRLHQEVGWQYHDRKSVFKEPWRVALRTRALCLRHSQVVKDASWCRSALPDYLIVMRKPGDPTVEIEHPNGFSEYPGTLPIFPPDTGWEEEWRALQVEYEGFTGHQRENKLSHVIWRRLASPFWDDVRIENVLPFTQSKDEDAEKHVCPLQLDVINRALMLWSIEGDRMVTPFMGVGSEVYCAVKMGRLAVGCELKKSYYDQSDRNVSAAESGWKQGQDQGSLF